MKYSALFCWLLLAWLAITTGAVAQWDTNTVRTRNLGSGVYYVGLGPSANYSLTTVANPLPGEIEDPDPMKLGFGNDALTDSADIQVKLRRNMVSNGYRAVVINTTAGQVLANISFRPTSGSATTYELDIPGPSLGTIDPVDSVFNETLKWTAVGAYLATVHTIAAVDPGCPCAGQNSSCTVHYPHDDACTGAGAGGSGPFNINRIRVFALCYGTTWVDVRHCCKSHDRELWCTPRASRGVSVQMINFSFFGCVASSVASHVASKVPWYCGGVITGGIVGAAQGLIAGGAAFAAVTVITNGQLIAGDNCYISAGNELNSCMCGGNVQTMKCGSTEEMCKGITGNLDLLGLSGPACFCDPNPKTMEVTPPIAGATYSWHTEGGATATQDPLNPHKASVTVVGNGTVTVTIEIPGCNLVRKFTKKVSNGVPPKPVITTHGGNVPTCIPRRPGTLFVADRLIDRSQAVCPTEYRLQVTSNAGGSIVASGAGGGAWSTNAYWITARPDVEGVSFCVTITARNQCGQSLPTTYCVSVDDDCPSVQGPTGIGHLSGLSTANYRDIGIMYPNPSTGKVKLIVEESDLGSPITVADANGSIVGTFVAGSKEQVLAVQDLPQGMYIVTMETKNGPVSRPLLIIK